VVFERTDNGWSAYPPALPGVGVVGATREDTEQLAAEAIALHLQALADDGLPIPESDAIDIGHVEAALPA
jgi:predicted RNase H-like HicB family nuclease